MVTDKEQIRRLRSEIRITRGLDTNFANQHEHEFVLFTLLINSEDKYLRL
jgi:hypothetical protein